MRDGFPKSLELQNLLSYIEVTTGKHIFSCPLPCTTTRTYTRRLGETQVKDQQNMDIIFIEEMQVTRTTVVPFSLVEFFSGVGGLLGLWLGLGAAQAVEMGLKLIFTRTLY